MLSSFQAQAESIRVAAAASLSHALPEIVTEFHRDSNHNVKLSFGSSGNLSRQIRQGAPFAVFLGADESYAQSLANDGYGESAVYAVGYLSLYVPSGSLLDASADLISMGRTLDRDRMIRFAIANPDHAPYGRMAKQALQRAELWQRIQARLVTGENAAQTAQFAITGSIDAALIPRSLAVLPALARYGISTDVPESLAPPLRQRMLLINGGGDAAREFFNFLRSEAARAILARHGFGAPQIN